MSAGAAAGYAGLATGLINMFAASEQAAQAQDMARAQYAIKLSNWRWDEMGNTLQHMYRNLQLSRENQARFRQNREIARAANSTRALKEKTLRDNIGSQLVGLSRGQRQSAAQLTSAAYGAGLSPNSGTVKALKRQLDENGRSAIQQLAQENYMGKQAIIREQEAALSRRDLHGYNTEAYYMPSQPPQYIDPPGFSTMQALGAFAGGASQGVGMVSDFNTMGVKF